MNEVDGSSVEHTMGDARESNEGVDVAPADVHKEHAPVEAPAEDMFADAGPVNPPMEASADVTNLHEELNNKEESNREQEQYDESEESFPEPVMACPQTPPQEQETNKVNEAVEDAYEDKEESFGNGGDGEPSDGQDEVMPDEY